MSGCGGLALASGAMSSFLPLHLIVHDSCAVVWLLMDDQVCEGGGNLLGVDVFIWGYVNWFWNAQATQSCWKCEEVSFLLADVASSHECWDEVEIDGLFEGL